MTKNKTNKLRPLVQQDFKSSFTIVPNNIIDYAYELKPVSLRLLLLVLERTNNKKGRTIHLRNDQVAEILNCGHASVSAARTIILLVLHFVHINILP